MAGEDDSLARLVEGLRRGDEKTWEDFRRLHGPELLRLVEGNIADALHPRIAAEDVVQSVLRTFLRRLQDMQFHFDTRTDLGRLLCTIALRKTAREWRRFARDKKSLQQKQETAGTLLARGEAGLEPVAASPFPAEAAALADELRQLLAGLDDEERQIVDLKLQGCTNTEIARRLHTSERTVYRRHERIRARLERLLEEE
jgi:RNA polymerase sigma factor (sigma-70 family)